MRLKNLAAVLAASSLLLSAPAAAASPAARPSVATAERAGAASEDESKIGGEGLRGFLLVFVAGLAAGALIYSLVKGGDDEPASP